MSATADGTAAVNEALYTISRHKIFARPMSEAEIVENRIEELRFIVAQSDRLNRTQRDQIEAMLDNLERATACLCPPEPVTIPPGLEDFQP